VLKNFLEAFNMIKVFTVCPLMKYKCMCACSVIKSFREAKHMREQVQDESKATGAQI
jgi:transposase